LIGFTIKGGNANGSINMSYEHITDYRSDTYSIDKDEAECITLLTPSKNYEYDLLYNTVDGGGRNA
jgi:hypothetical protein